jgi:hypothetical protein
MPIAARPEDIPADAVDITDDVNDLKDELEKLFLGKDLTLIGMSLGSLIGETFENPEHISALLQMISSMAATVFSANLEFQAGQGAIN